MSESLRGDLLPAICHYLPASEANLLGLMDPADYQTHVEAYVAVRRHHIDLPYDLLRSFVGGLLAHMDASFRDDVAVPEQSAQVLQFDSRKVTA